jgi:HD superfamily phosphodiesterase
MYDKVSPAIMKMARFYSHDKNTSVKMHDISHFMKVWGFARTIGLAEKLGAEAQETLELAAVVHDIACPLCREKYGSTAGPYQEREGAPMARRFYEEFRLPEKQLHRICFLVAHHHTYSAVDGLDYQILIEADFLVNADESALKPEAIRTFRDRVFRTETGKHLLNTLYCPDDPRNAES